MHLGEYLRGDLVLTGLRGPDRASVLHAIAGHISERDATIPGAAVEQALTLREESCCTVLGHGLAVPHATVPGLARPLLVVALAPEPISFGPEGTGPVRVFFVLLSPEGHEGEHIRLLARLVRLVRHPGFIDDVMEAESGEQVLAVIQSADRQHP